ncbi:MAG: squalene-hopene cyclase [Bacteriovoracaceae bacterium]|nr:squalene-hopene cyclase [Bacteriovoracaceae bacterium]
MLKPAQKQINPFHLLKTEVAPWREIEGITAHLQEVLWSRQEEDGHWHFALDDNITMNAEFILFHRWIALDDKNLIRRLAQGILDRQSPDGSWNIFYNGPGNLSASIEAYFALRVAGYAKTHSALMKAREFILSQGGIASCRVFTKIWLALFELFPWDGVPMIPPEILLAPKALPFHIYEFSYWSRTTIIPLTILFHLQKTVKLDFNMDELYQDPADKYKTSILPPPEADESWIIKSSRWDMWWINWEQVFVAINKGVSVYESKIPIKPLRNFCVQRARKWILEHQELSGDWGGIQPPMLNSIMALHAMGMEISETPIQKGLKALYKFTRGLSSQIRVRNPRESVESAVLQSCVSPIWDTALSALALVESGAVPLDPRLQHAKEYLWEKRIQTKGDWAFKAKLKRGHPFAAWCFQYENSLYPDVDDSTVVTLVLHKLGMTVKELEPATHWLFSMQNSDGGWGTFDRDNNQTILNRIPFADLKSLIDPSNPDVTGHVLETLGELGFSKTKAVKRAIRYLRKTQRPDGSWFGRWGVNLLYGTTAAIVGLIKCGEPVNSPYIQRAIKFILARQNQDGGWGESCDSYGLNRVTAHDTSTPSQTAWAMMALQTAKYHQPEVGRAIQKGISFLSSRQVADGLEEPEFTGTGFPQHFFLRYDGYRNYFPLIALGRIRT